MVFKRDEPHWGTFSTLVEDDHVYLWGHAERDVLLARVPLKCARTKAAYEYWDGQGYVKDPKDASPVMSGVAQGTIYRSRLFQSGQGRDYVFLGVSHEKTSQMLMSVAPRLEGPWTEWCELFTRPALITQEGWRYCMYPHPWAFKEHEGELMVSWCDHGPDAFVVARLKFEMGKA